MVGLVADHMWGRLMLRRRKGELVVAELLLRYGNECLRCKLCK